MTRRYGPVEHLHPDHKRDAFDCGTDAETEWLRKRALSAEYSGTSRVYVVRRLEDDLVVGYYALASGSVSREAVSERVAKGTGRYPIPIILLTRLGVDMSEQGQGLGRALLVDALRRVNDAAEIVGVRALLIHAEDETARDFYMRQAGFEQSPTDELHLMLLMKDLRLALSPWE